MGASTQTSTLPHSWQPLGTGAVQGCLGEQRSWAGWSAVAAVRSRQQLQVCEPLLPLTWQ